MSMIPTDADRIRSLESEVKRMRNIADEQHRKYLLAQLRVQELEAGIKEFVEYEDEHKPGPYVRDGNWLPSQPGPGTQICADEDCGLYWPCPAAKLAELLPPEFDDE